MVNGTGALPLGKRYLAELLGTDPDRDEYGEGPDLVASPRAAVVAGVAAVAVELLVRWGGYPALASVLAGVAAGVGAGLVVDGAPSEAIAGLLGGYLAALAGVVLAALSGIAVPGLVPAPDILFVWFTHLVVLPLATVAAAVAATGTAAVRDRLARQPRRTAC